jgi:hypothetical protein
MHKISTRHDTVREYRNFLHINECQIRGKQFWYLVSVYKIPKSTLGVLPKNVIKHNFLHTRQSTTIRRNQSSDITHLSIKMRRMCIFGHKTMRKQHPNVYSSQTTWGTCKIQTEDKQCVELRYTTPCYTKLLYTSCKLQITHSIAR